MQSTLALMMVLVVWQGFEAVKGQSQGFHSQLGLLGNSQQCIRSKSILFSETHSDEMLFPEALNITSMLTVVL